LHEDAAGVLEQLASSLREHHAASIAVEQVLAKLRFEIRNLAAQSRLADRQECGGMREAAEFGDVAKVFELFQIQIGGSDICYPLFAYQCKFMRIQYTSAHGAEASFGSGGARVR
jgi:hypothetical protein